MRAETRFSGTPLLHEHNVVSGMSVIIQGKRSPWGVLGTHTSKATVFTKDDISFIQTMANTLAIAIERRLSENARENAEIALHKETDLIRLLQEIAVTTNEASSVEEAMRTCIGKVCEFTKFSLGHVYLLDSNGILIPTNMWFFDLYKKYEVFMKATEIYYIC